MSEHDEPVDGEETESETAADGLLSSDQGISFRRVGHIVGIALLIVIVLPFVLYAVPQLIGAEYSYVVLSGSMQPVLDPGDITFVDSVEAEAVEQGDVVNFKRAEDTRTTTHRVIEVVEQDGERAFRTQGDNNEDPDQGLVTPDELRGRVMTVGGFLAAIPLVGYAIQYAGTQTGFTLLFVVPVTLLVLNEIWGVISSARSGEDQEAAADGGSEAASPEESAAEGSDDSADDSTDEEVTFSPNELRLAAGILVAFVAYAAWTAVGDPGPIRIGVTGSAVVALVLVGGLYLLGSTTDEGGPAASGDDPDSSVLRIQSETVPDAETVEDREPVSSLNALVEIADAADSPLQRDPDDGRYHVDAGETLYVYRPGGGDSGGEGATTHGPTETPTEGATLNQPADESRQNGTDHQLDMNTEADDD